MKIIDSYSSFFESRLQGRYVTSKMIAPLLKGYQDDFKISVIGRSEKSVEIKMLSIGNGPKKILAWSQMHGNESTTTKAIFDLFKFLSQKKTFQYEIKHFLDTHSLHVIPILNPDGALAYTRENANKIDLNRDAQQLTQCESRVLASVFREINPDLCLNLHDQRTIYGFDNGKTATVSFLAPAADEARSLTPSRLKAMNNISKMAGVLTNFIPGQVGRYDDGFNANCVGDTFQMAKVPVILFEAGHYDGDYNREETRKYICYALLTLFGFVTISEENTIAYDSLPENRKNHYDIILRNVSGAGFNKTTDIAIQYREILQNDSIKFVPYIEKIGDLEGYFGHNEIDANFEKVLINSQQKWEVGDKISTIFDKTLIL